MAKSMVTISDSTCNKFLEVSATNDAILFNKYPGYSFSDGNHPELGTIVGLGFAAVLAEGSQIDICCIHVGAYLRYRNFYHYDNVDKLSSAIAQVISVSMRAFEKLGHPRYYDDFIWAIYRVINIDYPIPVEIKQAIEKILKINCL